MSQARSDALTLGVGCSLACIAILVSGCGRSGFEYAFEDDGGRIKEADAGVNAIDGSMDGAAPSGSLTRQIEGDFNDSEEAIGSGNVDTQSFDLDLGYDNVKPLIVGMRFENIDIPNGSTIISATIQFTVRGTEASEAAFTFFAEDDDHAPIFTGSAGDLSARVLTSESVNWSPLPWFNDGDATDEQRTPNLASIVESVIGRSNWSSGNALAIIVTGTGQRSAISHDNEPLSGPKLRIDYAAP